MGIMTKQPKLEDGNHYSQTHAYSLSTIANSPLSPASTVAGSFTPRATSQAPTAQGIALRPSTLAPTTTAPNGYQPMPTGPNTGPMTSSIAVPARPKPGRKAATDEPDNKRKAQNRAAQRAFRERKTNVQKGLEYDNNVLRATNDTLLAELTSLRAQAEHDRNRMDALEQQVAESTARENESRTKWENNLTSMTAFQQQRQEAENRAEEALATARRCQDEVQRMTMELNMYKTRLSELPAQLNASASVKANSLSRPQVPAQNATITFQIPQKRQLVIDGCGDCEENGACPCVDSYVDDSGPAMSRDGIPPLNRNMSTASMSINNLLSPPDMNTAQKDSQSDVPELTSDQSSPEELEIDFTNHFAKVHSNTHIQTSDKCGFCYDPSNCICADTEATLQSVKAMALPVKTKPGTCIQCQQNPEQKAYCESLALQTKTERELAEGQPDPKRTRTEGQNITIGCADAYAVFKQVNIKSGGRPSFDDVYNTFMNSNPPSRRGTEAAANDMETKPRQFSAYETNIAAVLTTLGKDFRKNSITEWTTPTTCRLEELPHPQPQMMDIHNLRRPSTAPGFGGPTFANPFSGDAMQWAPAFPSGPMTGYATRPTTPGVWQTFSGPVTPGIFATAFAFPTPTMNDLSRYSLSIPNSAPASPGGRNADVVMETNV